MTRDHMIRVLAAGVHGPDRARRVLAYASLSPAVLRHLVSHRLTSRVSRVSRETSRAQFRAPAATAQKD